MLAAFRQDLAYAIRGLRLRPGFTAGVILTLALGVGANGVMFSIVDRLLFRPPPMLRDPATAHRIYTFTTFRGQERAGGVSQYARYVDLTKWTTSFSSTAGFTPRQMAIGDGADAREMQVAAVSASFFGFFDAPPVRGRYFTTAEDSIPRGADVTVLSWPFWQTALGGRDDAIGKTIRIGAVTYSIIGVTPKGFAGVWPEQPPVAYIPITNYAAGNTGMKDWWTTYNWGWMNMLARRKPAVTNDAANTDLTQAMLKSYQAFLALNPRGTPIALARPHAMAGSILQERGPRESDFAKVATWLAGVALVVLLIACANVANLLLARALRRRREIALRLALGVSRARLVVQLLTESVILAAAGGVAGLLVAWGGRAWLLSVINMPNVVLPGFFTEGRTLGATLAAALAAGLLAGLAPAWQTRHANLAADLKAGAREGTHLRSRARTGLLLFQAALSVVLLIGAGLFVRSLHNVRGLRLGYDPDAVVMVDIRNRGVTLDSTRMVGLRQQLLTAARTVPGVSHASLVSAVPFWSHWSQSLYVAGIDTVGKLGQFELNPVSSEYFATMGTRIIRGRGIADADIANAPRVMIVSQAMGETLWPGADPMGQCVRMGSDTTPCFTVVGIAENIKNSSLATDKGLYYYLSSAQFQPQSGGLFVRSSAADATPIIASLRARLQQEMPGASYVIVRPFSDVIGGETRSWRLGAILFAAFGSLALALAAIGLYSVIAYSVAQRTHELGVRVALGAQVGDVVRLVVGQGVKLGAAGIVIGAAIALGAGRWLRPLLFDVSPRDPGVFVTVTVTLLTVAAAASWLPALRAARVDPNTALRAE